jgi:hypothetical protein
MCHISLNKVSLKSPPHSHVLRGVVKTKLKGQKIGQITGEQNNMLAHIPKCERIKM